ncbi:MAG: hypothetical protein AMXMBFR84_01980 [Candidatus Hydrogenedentota bacterium]
MFLSIRDCMVAGDEFASPVEGLRHLGVEAAEIALDGSFHVLELNTRNRLRLESDADVDAYRDHLGALGVRASCLLTEEDAGERGDYVDWMTRAVEVAERLETPCLRVDPVMKRAGEMSFDERVMALANPLKEVIRRTPKSRVSFGLENHGVFGNNLAFLLNVFQEVGSDRVGMTVDTGNFYWRGYPLTEVYGILKILAPYAKHTHVKNINYPLETREKQREAGWEYGTYMAPLDEGDIDHRVVADILKKAGYRGDFCIEDESLEKFEAGADRRAVLERDVLHVRAVLENA